MTTYPITSEPTTRPIYRGRAIDTDVTVPFLRALLMALAWALLLGVLAGFTRSAMDTRPWTDNVATGLVVALFAFLAILVRALGAEFDLRRTLQLAEAGLYQVGVAVDLDGDNQIGPDEDPIIIRAADGSTKTMTRAGPVATPRPPIRDGRQDLYAFLRRAYTVGVARSDWLPPGRDGQKPWRFQLPSGRPVTRNRYDRYMSILDQAGLGRDPGSGWELTLPIGEAMELCGLASLWNADGRPGEPSPTGQAGTSPGRQATQA